MHKPYLKYLGEFGKFRAYQMDGNFIRDNLDIEFTNFGSYDDFPDMIPKDELWLDVEYTPNEQNLFLGHMLVGEEAGYKAGKRWESYQRGKTPNIGPIKKVLWKIVDGFSVFIVDGRAVRNIYVNFTEGGHHWRYKFVPEDEIWLDDDLLPEEREPVLVHELDEIHSMRDLKMSYEPAHERASFVESVVRNMKDVGSDFLVGLKKGFTPPGWRK